MVIDIQDGMGRPGHRKQILSTKRHLHQRQRSLCLSRASSLRQSQSRERHGPMPSLGAMKNAQEVAYSSPSRSANDAARRVTHDDYGFKHFDCRRVGQRLCEGEAPTRTGYHRACAMVSPDGGGVVKLAYDRRLARRLGDPAHNDGQGRVGSDERRQWPPREPCRVRIAVGAGRRKNSDRST